MHPEKSYTKIRKRDKSCNSYVILPPVVIGGPFPV